MEKLKRSTILPNQLELNFTFPKTSIAVCEARLKALNQRGFWGLDRIVHVNLQPDQLDFSINVKRRSLSNVICEGRIVNGIEEMVFTSNFRRIGVDTTLFTCGSIFWFFVIMLYIQNIGITIAIGILFATFNLFTWRLRQSDRIALIALLQTTFLEGSARHEKNKR